MTTEKPSRTISDALTTRHYWDTSRYAVQSGALTRCLPESFFDCHLLRILRRFLRADVNFAELGIAPGLHTIRIARHTGAVPHGFDFANAGVEQTKRNFSAAGFSPDNVHLLDVTASNVSTTHSDRYDVVYSNGLVEHFVDVTPVLANHASFVRSGGTVAVIVPNLVFVRALVPPDLQAIHNFAIMSPEALIASLPPNLTPIEAGYLGGIADLGLFVARNRLVNAFRLAGYLLQRLTIDIAQRALLKVGVDLSNRWFSPGVYVVARKV